jgi:hypothetical protein
MNIKPSEIESVEQIGVLDGSPVRMLRTTGGYYIAMGKPKSKKQEEALGSGSHAAIVKYNIEKQFSSFQPTLAKSEALSGTQCVTGYSELLPQPMRSRGYEMFSLQKGGEIDYVLTRHGYEAHKYTASLTADAIRIEKAKSRLSDEMLGFSAAVGGAAARMAIQNGKEFIEHCGHKFVATKVMKG